MMRSSTQGLRRNFVALLASLGMLDAHAVPFPDLYTVTVKADAQATDQRAAAIELGMVSLLARLTGRTNAGRHPDLTHIVERASNYVNSYGLVDRETAQIGFIGSAVEQAVAAANWPLWGAERPLTLVWMAVDAGNGERGILASSLNAEEWTPEMAELMRSLHAQLQEAAKARGLPLTLPLLDLFDIEAVSFADVAGGFSERIATASERYRADASLLALVRNGPFGPEIRWTLEQGGRRRIVLTSTIADGLDWVAERYAAEFSSAGAAGALHISVLDVDSLEDYGRVMSYLESVSLFESVDVESFQGTTLNLLVSVRGDETVLQRVLGLGGVLAAPTTLPFPPPPPGSVIFEVVEPGFVQ